MAIILTGVYRFDTIEVEIMSGASDQPPKKEENSQSGAKLMGTPVKNVEELATQEYKYGFVTEVEQETIPRGLSEDVVRMISAKKNEPEWLLEWRLKAYRHWLT